MIGVGISLWNAALQGGGSTVLRRETDGTITVVSLAATWTPQLTREGDGTITVSQ